jgi:hypothetical protein
MGMLNANTGGTVGIDGSSDERQAIIYQVLIKLLKCLYIRKGMEIMIHCRIQLCLQLTGQ